MALICLGGEIHDRWALGVCSNEIDTGGDFFLSFFLFFQVLKNQVVSEVLWHEVFKEEKNKWKYFGP